MINYLIYNRCRWLLLMAVTCIYYINTNAQGFSKRYIDIRPAMQYAGLLVNNSEFYTVGITTIKSPPFITKPLWSKISSDGILIDYTVLKDSDSNQYGTFFNTYALDGDSLIKLFGYIEDTANLFPVLWTINYNGDVKSVIVYPDSLSYLIRGDYMLSNEAGNYYLGASYQYTPGAIDAYIIKTDIDDSVLWKKRYGAAAPWDESVTSLALLGNGNTLVGSYKYDQNLPNMKSYTWLFEIDGDGNVVRQWFDSLNTMEAKALRQTSDGGFIYATKRIIQQSINDVTCRTVIQKLDSGFNKQWKFEGSMTMGSSAGAADIEELQNGDFLICGNGNYINPRYNLLSGWVMKLHTDGTVAWSQGYTALDTPGVTNYLNDIDVLPDGSYVAVGYANLPSSVATSQSQQAWMLKIDSNGCLLESCLVGLEDDRLETLDNRQIQIQPNPATGNVQLTIENEMLGGVISVYNITGALVLQQTAEAGKTQLNLATLSKGMYVVTVQKQSTVARGKLVVE